LLDHPPVLTRMKALLGNCIQLHSATARVTTGGAPDQDWHRDGHWPVDPEGTPYGSIPGQINCGYYLDELTMDNGPIAIVPGSHRAPFKPPKGYPEFPDQKYVLAKPGQAVMFNGWLYHRGVANQSQESRRVCLMCYQNAWMKSRESFDGPRAKKMLEHGTNEQKLLLGAVTHW
ncbi:MAG: phytanoyl-CoA dioxygenase family protein, partial [Chloroflexota bacterium]